MSEKTPPAYDYRSGIVEDVRPWGKFRRFPHEDAGSIKIITVEPGGRLSLQYHEGRAEFWVVLDPGLEITVGDRPKLYDGGGVSGCPFFRNDSVSVSSNAPISLAM